MACVGANPSITVGKCSGSLQYVDNFRLDDNSSYALQPTNVALCYEDQSLFINAFCTDDNIVSPYSECNQDLYNADVFEVFLAAYQTTVPTNYLEIELSPYSVLFVAQVNNPDDMCTGIADKLIDCTASQVSYNASLNANGWAGFIEIPFSLIQSASYP
eukprot:gene5610-6468_t